MKYYYEYKQKNGCKFAGHNLEKVDFSDNCIILFGVDIVETNEGYVQYFWKTLLDINDIEYFKIEPMIPIIERND